MTTEIEFKLEKCSTDTFEKLCSDFLTKEGYDVSPTGTKGKDKGIDAFLDNRQGTAHYSTTKNWKKKIEKDAKKTLDYAEKHDENFNKIVFITNYDPTGENKDNLKEKIEKKYRWNTKIYSLEDLRTKIESKYTDIARNHLGIDQKKKQQSKKKIQSLKDSRIKKIKKRINIPVDIEKGSTVSIHLFPEKVHTKKYKTSINNLPGPPIFGAIKTVGGIKTGEGKWISTRRAKPYTNYTFIHKDGWFEGVHTKLITEIEGKKQISGSELDPAIVKTIQGGLKRLEKMNVEPPIYVYITLSGIDDCILQGTYKNYKTKKFKRNEYGVEEVINSFDDDIPNSLSEPLNNIWREAGWQKGSHHYTEEGNWDPKNTFIP